MPAGIDGIISDNLSALTRIVRGRSDIRLATTHDNPFRPLNESYGLTIRTGDDGTDANIKFTIDGALGSAAITVNTAPLGRMEGGGIDFVTIPSKNLGALRSITVENDGTGNRPDWFIRDIEVQSGRWLGTDPSFHYYATLNGTNSGHGFDKIPFQSDMFVLSDIRPAIVGFTEGTITDPDKTLAAAYLGVGIDGTIHVATGTYPERITLSKPCTLIFWSDHGKGPAVIGKS